MRLKNILTMILLSSFILLSPLNKVAQAEGYCFKFHGRFIRISIGNDINFLIQNIKHAETPTTPAASFPEKIVEEYNKSVLKELLAEYQSSNSSVIGFGLSVNGSPPIPLQFIGLQRFQYLAIERYIVPSPSGSNIQISLGRSSFFPSDVYMQVTINGVDSGTFVGFAC